MNAPATELNLKPEEETIRVYADIAASAYLKMKVRCAQIGLEKGKIFTRKAYLEHLIENDLKSVAGSSARVVEHRMEGTNKSRRKDQR